MTAIPPASLRSRRAALWCCLGAGFATLVDATVVAFTAPTVQASLGLSTAALQWYLACFSLTFGLGLAPAGRLGDAWGRRGLFLAGLALFTVGGVLSAFAGDGTILVVGRLAQGFGAGVLSAQVLGIVQDLYHGTERIRALGAYTVSGAAAAVAGPVLTGAILATLPPDAAWRVVLLLPIPFALATLVLGAVALPRGRRAAVRAPRGLDLVGIALLGLLVVLVTLPAIDPGVAPPVLVGIGIGAVATITLLWWWERRYARRGRLPLFAPELMRSSGFVLGNVVALLWFGSFLALGTVTTVAFLAHGIPALLLAVVGLPAAGARMIAAHSAHRVFARWGPRVVAVGVGAQTLVLVGLAVAAPFLDLVALFVVAASAQVVLGLAGGITEPPLRAVTLGAAPAHLHGVAASFLQLTQRMSATFFVALATGILLAFGGGSDAATLATAIAVCAVGSLGAAVAAGVRGFRAVPSATPTVILPRAPRPSTNGPTT